MNDQCIAKYVLFTGTEKQTIGVPVGITTEHMKLKSTILFKGNLLFTNCSPRENAMTSSWHITAPKSAHTSSGDCFNPILIPEIAQKVNKNLIWHYQKK